MDQVDHDVDLRSAAASLGADQVQLVLGAVNQDDPGPQVERVAGPGLAERGGDHIGEVLSGEKPNRKRMAALVAVYDAGPARRRPRDVIAPPGGRHGDRRPRPGPGWPGP